MGFTAESAFEGVTGAVCEQGGHTRCGEARGGLGVVVAVLVGRVGVDALALCLTPTDAPRRVACSGSNGYDAADKARRSAERPFEDGHAAHGTANNDCDGLYAEMVEDEFVRAVDSSTVR